MFSLKHFGKTKYAAALAEIERKPSFGDGGRSMFMMSDSLKQAAEEEKSMYPRLTRHVSWRQ